MRKFWLLTFPILLAVAFAVPGGAAEPTLGVAACPATPAITLPQSQPAPLFLTGYLCGTCSGGCSGLLTGATCNEGGDDGICLGIVSPNGTRARCLPGTGTGYACTCSA